MTDFEERFFFFFSEFSRMKYGSRLLYITEFVHLCVTQIQPEKKHKVGDISINPLRGAPSIGSFSWTYHTRALLSILRLH